MADIDRLSSLLERFRVHTRLFHTGPLCTTTRFDALPGRGFLHVLRGGTMSVTHHDGHDGWAVIDVDRPSLLFYPRPVDHVFASADPREADLTCASLDFDGALTHPLVRALPHVVVLPLDAVPTLSPALDLLFAEVDAVRCGRRLVADRLFEVVLIQLFRWLLDHASDLSLPPGLIPGLSDERLAPALVAMHEDPGAAWSVDALARSTRMSRSAFAARFARSVGRSPGDYLTDWRLTVAQDLLRRGSSVSATAIELGYANPSAFSRVFAQRLGVSPRAWVRENHGSSVCQGR